MNAYNMKKLATLKTAYKKRKIKKYKQLIADTSDEWTQ